MALACLQPKFFFGLKGGIKSDVHYVDDCTLVYPAGINCVFLNTDQRTQTFIAQNPKGKGISCIEISNNRQFIAIAERGERAFIGMYDTKTRKRLKILVTTEIVAKEYVCLAFSADDKYLAAQGGSPDWNLSFWLWEKGRLLTLTCTCNINTPSAVQEVVFHPFDPFIIAVVGSGIFRILRLTEGNFKQSSSPKAEGLHLTAAVWVVEDRLVVGSDNGTISIFDNTDLRYTLQICKMVKQEASASLKNDKLEELPEYRLVPLYHTVTCILNFSKGLLIACGPGCVYLFEKALDEKEYYKQTRVIKIPQDLLAADPTRTEEQIIMWMTVNPSEETLAVSTNQLQLYLFHLSGLELNKSFEVTFEFLAQPFHYKTIIDLDVCIRKPIIVTCSIDKSLRLWDYETCNSIIHREFSQDILCVSIHPAGFFLIVGFEDCLRLMNILIDDIRVFNEIPMRGCRSCRFNNGGSLFAVLQGNIIQVFSAITMDNITSLKGHHAKVTCILWSTDDSRLISCGVDGAVYEWDAILGRRIGDSVVKGSSYLHVAITPDNKVLIAITTERQIREITESQVLRQITNKELMTSIALSHSGRYLFVSSTKGNVMSVKFPLSALAAETQDYLIHSASITKIHITYDDQYLVTASEDASLCIWKIVDREGRSLKRDKEIIFAKETLITEAELEEKNSIIDELKQRVSELKTESEYQMRVKDMKYADKMREMTERFTTEMEGLRMKLTQFQEEKDKLLINQEENIRALTDKFMKEQEEQESLSNHKLILEYDKYHELQTFTSHLQEEYDGKINEFEQAKDAALEELTEHFEEKLKERVSQLEMAREQSQSQYIEHEEIKRQIEEDGDREILDIKTKFEKKLKEERDINLRLKADSALLKKKFTIMQKEIDEHKLSMQRGHQEQQKLQGIIKALEKDITTLKKEIQERDGTIQDKENKIYDLKKKNQELEKFKFVLDYKIKELKKQLDPKDNQIREMKDQISAMEIELNKFRLENQKLELDINTLRQKLRAMDKEMRDERGKAVDVENAFNRLKTDIYVCVGFIQNPKQLKQNIKAIYQKHIHTQKSGAFVEDDLDILAEHMNQREHLEHTVISLRKKLNKDTKLHYSDYFRIMKQNVMLIKEINDLRHELKTARAQLNDIEKMLHLGKEKMNRIETQAKIQMIIQQITEAVAERETKLVEKERILHLQLKEINSLYNKFQSGERSVLNGQKRSSSTVSLPSVSA